CLRWIVFGRRSLSHTRPGDGSRLPARGRFLCRARHRTGRDTRQPSNDLDRRTNGSEFSLASLWDRNIHAKVRRTTRDDEDADSRYEEDHSELARTGKIRCENRRKNESPLRTLRRHSTERKPHNPRKRNQDSAEQNAYI